MSDGSVLLLASSSALTASSGKGCQRTRPPQTHSAISSPALNNEAYSVLVLAVIQAIPNYKWAVFRLLIQKLPKEPVLEHLNWPTRFPERTTMNLMQSVQLRDTNTVSFV